MFLTRTAANVNRFRPPLGLLGGIKTEPHPSPLCTIDAGATSGRLTLQAAKATHVMIPVTKQGA